MHPRGVRESHDYNPRLSLSTKHHRARAFTTTLLPALIAGLLLTLAGLASPPRTSSQPTPQPTRPAPPPKDTPRPASAPLPKDPPPSADRSNQPNPWEPRLAQLDPATPWNYFLLAEELAGDTADAQARTIARQLYVLAYELDQKLPKANRTVHMAPSVCLGLAAIARRDEEARWLVALARSLDDAPASPSSATSAPRAAAPRAGLNEVALDAATAIGLARSGEGRRAEALLDKPGVNDLLTRLDSGGPGQGAYSVSSFVRRAIRDWPVCPQCRNRRAVPAGTKQGEMVLCDTCRGTPCPKMSTEELIFQLRIESSLLQGQHRSWAAQVIADGGAPLRDLDASELAATFLVDPAKPYWKDGAWSESH